MEYLSVQFQMFPHDPGWVCGLKCFIHCGENVTMQPVQPASTLSPDADPHHRFSLILPRIFDDPDGLVRVEIFLALASMLLQDPLVHFYSNAWAGGNLRMTILYL